MPLAQDAPKPPTEGGVVGTEGTQPLGFAGAVESDAGMVCQETTNVFVRQSSNAELLTSANSR